MYILSILLTSFYFAQVDFLFVDVQVIGAEDYLNFFERRAKKRQSDDVKELLRDIREVRDIIAKYTYIHI